MVIFNATSPMERLGVDFIGPLPETKSGNKYILLFIDHFTKWVEAVPTSNQEATTVVEHLISEIICRHGTPKELLSDRGAQFLSELVKEITTQLGIHTIRTSAYHPQANGQTERVNGTIEKILRKYISVNADNWDKQLKYALAAYRFTPHASTGETPMMLVYGREAKLPLEAYVDGNNTIEHSYNNVKVYKEELKNNLQELYKEVKDKLKEASESRKQYYDKNRKEVSYKEGDEVLLKKENRKHKLEKLYEGPYKVIEVRGVNLKIQNVSNNEDIQLVHVTRVKPFKDDAEHQQVELDLPDDNEFWEVEGIVDERLNGNIREYLVKWRGFTKKNNQWVREEDFRNEEVVKEWRKTHKPKVNEKLSIVEKEKIKVNKSNNQQLVWKVKDNKENGKENIQQSRSGRIIRKPETLKF
jgi:hypothetical protein